MLADLLLMFVWGTLLPLWLILPSFDIYLHENLRVDAIQFRENITRQLEHILVVSFANLFTNLLPLLSSMMSLAELKTVLAAADHAGQLRTQTRSTGDTVMQRRRGVLHKAESHIVAGDPAGGKFTGRLVSSWYMLSSCYGVAVLIVCIQASPTFRDQSDTTKTCVHEVYPWFSTKHACIGRKVDCVELGITGQREQLAELLVTFEASSLANLHISSCSHLEIPSTIHRFDRLTALSIHNSTLYEWGSDAVVSRQTIPSLRALMLSDLDLKTVPLGLVTEPLPPKVESVVLCNLNTTVLLDAVGVNWELVKVFACDSCSLTAVPAVVQTMSHLNVLVLRDNGIASVMDDAFASARESLYAIFLDGNLLSSLPADVWELTATCDLSIQRTNVSVPSVYLQQLGTATTLLYGYASPICNSSDEHGRFFRAYFAGRCSSEVVDAADPTQPWKKKNATQPNI